MLVVHAQNSKGELLRNVFVAINDSASKVLQLCCCSKPICFSVKVQRTKMAEGETKKITNKFKFRAG